MTICILTPRFPFPENGGDVLRINNIARHLKRQGHKLILVSFIEDNKGVDYDSFNIYDKVYTVKRYKFFTVFFSLFYFLLRKPIQCGYYYSPLYLRKLRELIKNEQPDLFIAHLLRMSPYLEKVGVESHSIVEMTDALSKTYSIAKGAKGGTIKKLIYKMEMELIKKYELHVIKKFPKVVLVSKADIEYLQKSNTGDICSLALHSNGVECLEKLPSTYDKRKICFVGNMRTLQNQDAVVHFVEDIFPIIKKQIPDVKFYIIGAQPTPRIKALASDNIVVTGFVDDINQAVSDSCIAVAPVRVAAGIQNKVLVAMGCGVPVVLSSLISKAIPELKDSENCYIKDDNEAFASTCIEMLTKQNKREYIGRKGFETVRQYYSWDTMLTGYID